MKQTKPGSRMEIWDSKYINIPKNRQNPDKTVEIIQIEPSNIMGDFMVEVIEKEGVINANRN